MAEIFDNTVANDVATKKKYVKPEIDVVELDRHQMLLAGSNFGAGFKGIGEEDI